MLSLDLHGGGGVPTLSVTRTKKSLDLSGTDDRGHLGQMMKVISLGVSERHRGWLGAWGAGGPAVFHLGAH